MDEKTSAIPIEANLSQESFSSNAHGALLFAEEAKDYSGMDYKIPDAHGVDTLRLLPVNVNTIFLYWEITEKLLAGASFETFALKLYDTNNVGEKEILGFYFKDKISSRYANAHMPSKNILAVIGGIDASGRFVELLRSNKLKMPNDSLSSHSDEEVWMSKHSEWVELIKASASHFSHAKSSMSLIREMEFLKKYSEKAVFGQSSSELIRKD